jgi:TatD family-associated radical SAM protein
MFLYKKAFAYIVGEIVYYERGDKKHAYLNITPSYECTNDCVFCDKQVLESKVGANLFLEKSPSLDQVIRELKEKIEPNVVEEFVFCGIGEPLIYLDKLLGITRHIKKEYGKPVRINTNGQAYVLYPARKVVRGLEKAGVDALSISLNVMDKESYQMLHRPKHPESFGQLIRFIKDCNASSMKTYVSFLEFPKLKKNKALEFTRSLGLKDEQVRFRKFLSKKD